MSYIFGGSTGETPESIAKKRKVAMALAANASRTPRNVGEGLNAIGNAIAYRAMTGRANRAEEAGKASASKDFGKLIAAMSGGDRASAAPDIAGAEEVSFPNDRYRSAIAAIESRGSGDYSAIGPTHERLGRALGKYQIMEANIAPWSKAALGREVTADEFMASAHIQDDIFDHRFGQYVNKFGEEGAAQAWFGGPGGVGKVNRKDSLGTDVGSYGQKFMSQLGSPPQGSSNTPQAPQRAGNGLSLTDLAQVASNPFLSKGQNAVVNALIQRQMGGQAPVRGVQVGGKLVNPVDGSVIYEGEQEEQSSFSLMSADEAQAQGLSPVPHQIGPNGRLYPMNPPSGTSIEVGPDGTVKYNQGSGVSDGAKLNELQSKNAVFATRAEGALQRLDKIDGALTSVQGKVGDALGPAGNFIKSEDYQLAQQAGLEFLQAILRKDTGAAITAQEQSEYGRVYLPQPGDAPSVLIQKQASRTRALNAIKAGMTPAAMLAQERAMETQASGTALGEQSQAALKAARDALAKGADRAKVIERLEQAGIDASGL